MCSYTQLSAAAMNDTGCTGVHRTENCDIQNELNGTIDK